MTTNKVLNQEFTYNNGPNQGFIHLLELIAEAVKNGHVDQIFINERTSVIKPVMDRQCDRTAKLAEHL